MENLILNNLFKKAIEFNPTGILIFDSENKIQFANKIALRLFGLPENDFYDLDLSSVFFHDNGNDERPYFSPFVDNKRQDLELVEYNLLGRHKNGKSIPLKVSGVYTKIETKIYFLAYLKEIPSKASDQETNILLSKIFHESLNDIYIISAETLLFVNANTGALKKIGYTLEEIRHLSPWDLKSDLDDLQFSQRIDPLIKRKTKKIIFESKFKCKDSSTYPVEIHLQLFESGDRKVFMETVIDLSEKKRMERDHMNTLIQVQESEKERIAKELHDDLGQSLTAIQLNINTLEQSHDKPSTINTKDIYGKLNYIIQNSIADLKTISRDLMPSVLMDFGLVKALQYLCDSFTSPYLQVNLQVYNMDQVLETTQRVALYRIAQELINNSIKHGNAKEVNVQLIKNEKNILLTVEDDGIGFDVNNSIYSEGLGIKSIQSRVIALEGNFSFDSRLEYGTSALVEIPLNYSL